MSQGPCLIRIATNQISSSERPKKSFHFSGLRARKASLEAKEPKIPKKRRGMSRASPQASSLAKKPKDPRIRASDFPRALESLEAIHPKVETSGFEPGLQSFATISRPQELHRHRKRLEGFGKDAPPGDEKAGCGFGRRWVARLFFFFVGAGVCWRLQSLKTQKEVMLEGATLRNCTFIYVFLGGLVEICRRD